MRKSWALAVAAVLGMVGASVQADAVVTLDLNLRSQPSAQSSRLAVMPQGARVDILGCLPQGWCDVTMGNLRGWASGRYLRQIAPTVIYLRSNQGTIFAPTVTPVTQRVVLVPATGWNTGYQIAAPSWPQTWAQTSGGGWYLQR